MQILKMKPKARTTPADAFAIHYEWLLRWALHFVHDDRAAAEDLVQDTFVRFVLQQIAFDDPNSAQPLLYTYLKHSHLSGVRQAQRHPFQSFSVAEFDTLQMGLRQQNSVDPIEIQDTLRLIVAYLAWRKRSSKSASILILRFFHGYFPEEIMKICLLSRQSVDYGVNAARDEVQLYLEDPSRLRIMHHEAPPEVHLSHTAADADLLMEELQETLLRARDTACLRKEQLLRHYITEDPQPIPTELLAHIVSCRSCLDLISKYHDMPPLSGRSSQESLGFAKRPGKSTKRGASRVYGLKESLRMAEQRFRETFEHRPKVLLLLVNGQVVASQEVQSFSSNQTVGIRSCDPSDFIEVITDQNVCLLSMAIDAVPPDCDPTIRQHVALSDDRSIDALLSFTSSGCVVEIRYHDPKFHLGDSMEAKELYERELGDGSEVGGANAELNPTVLVPEILRPSPFERLCGVFRRNFLPVNFVGLKASLVLLLIATVMIFVWHQQTPHVTPSELLARAEDSSSSLQERRGVSLQKVRIRASGKTLERSIYRDLQGKRHARTMPFDASVEKIQTELAGAGVNWDDPLSASSYSDWRKQHGDSRDEVRRTGRDRLTLTSTVPAGPVSVESLTIRESDFHPIERTVEYRDTGLVEISELSYNVMPWEEVGPDIFEPLSSEVLSISPSRRAAVAPALHLKGYLSDQQLDEADLEARLALTRLNAYTSERIEIVRRPDGVQVKGIVATTERKREIEDKLRFVAHVIPSLMTFQEMQSKEQSSRAAELPVVVAQSSEGVGVSPLERYLSATGESQAAASALAQQLMASSLEASRHSKAISDMAKQYGTGENLSLDARGALRMLLADQTMKLLVALNREQSLLAQVNAHARSPDAVESIASDDVSAVGEQNFQLCMKLTSGQVEPEQSVPSLVDALETNLATLRQAAEHVAANGLYPERSHPDPQALNMHR